MPSPISSPPCPLPIPTVKLHGQIFPHPDYHHRRPGWMIPMAIALVTVVSLLVGWVFRAMYKMSSPPAPAPEAAQPPPPPPQDEWTPSELSSAFEDEEYPPS